MCNSNINKSNNKLRKVLTWAARCFALMFVFFGINVIYCISDAMAADGRCAKSSSYENAVDVASSESDAKTIILDNTSVYSSITKGNEYSYKNKMRGITTCELTKENQLYYITVTINGKSAGWGVDYWSTTAYDKMYANLQFTTDLNDEGEIKYLDNIFYVPQSFVPNSGTVTVKFTVKYRAWAWSDSYTRYIKIQRGSNAFQDTDAPDINVGFWDYEEYSTDYDTVKGPAFSIDIDDTKSQIKPVTFYGCLSTKSNASSVDHCDFKQEFTIGAGYEWESTDWDDENEEGWKIPTSNVIAGTYYFYFTQDISDYMGNKVAAFTVLETFYIDHVAPTTSGITISNSSGGNWTDQDVTLTFSGATDTMSGIKSYTFSGATASSSTATTATFSAEMNATVSVTQVCDYLDNCATVSNKTSNVKIRKEYPDITPTISSGTGTVESPNIYLKKGSVLTFLLKDDTSGIVSGNYLQFQKIDNKSPVEDLGYISVAKENTTHNSLSAMKYTITINTQEDVIVTARFSGIKDNGGIIAPDSTYYLIIDNKAPTLSVTASDSTSGFPSGRNCTSASNYCHSPAVSVIQTDTYYESQTLTFSVKYDGVSISGINSYTTIEDVKNEKPIQVYSSLTSDSFNLSKTVDIYVNNFTDKAGNDFCSGGASSCKVTGLYISDSDPNIQLSYKGIEPITTFDSPITIPNGVSEFSIMDSNDYYPSKDYDLKLYIANGKHTSINVFSNDIYTDERTCWYFYCEYTASQFEIVDNTSLNEKKFVINKDSFKYLLVITVYGSAGDTENKREIKIILDTENPLVDNERPTSTKTVFSNKVDDGFLILNNEISDTWEWGSSCTDDNDSETSKTCDEVKAEIDKIIGLNNLTFYNTDGNRKFADDEYKGGNGNPIGFSLNAMGIKDDADQAECTLNVVDNAGNITTILIKYSKGNDPDIKYVNAINSNNLKPYDDSYYFLIESLGSSNVIGIKLNITISSTSTLNPPLRLIDIGIYKDTETEKMNSDTTKDEYGFCTYTATDKFNSEINVYCTINAKDNTAYTIKIQVEDQYGNLKTTIGKDGQEQPNIYSKTFVGYSHTLNTDINKDDTTSLLYSYLEDTNSTNNKITIGTTDFTSGWNYEYTSGSVPTLSMYLPRSAYQDKKVSTLLTTNFKLADGNSYQIDNSYLGKLQDPYINIFDVDLTNKLLYGSNADGYEHVKYQLVIILLDASDFDLDEEKSYSLKTAVTLDIDKFVFSSKNCVDENGGINAYCGEIEGKTTSSISTTEEALSLSGLNLSAKDVDSFKDGLYLFSSPISLPYPNEIKSSRNVTVYYYMYLYTSDIQLTPVYCINGSVCTTEYLGYKDGSDTIYYYNYVTQSSIAFKVTTGSSYSTVSYKGTVYNGGVILVNPPVADENGIVTVTFNDGDVVVATDDGNILNAASTYKFKIDGESPAPYVDNEDEIDSTYMVGGKIIIKLQVNDDISNYLYYNSKLLESDGTVCGNITQGLTVKECYNTASKIGLIQLVTAANQKYSVSSYSFNTAGVLTLTFDVGEKWGTGASNTITSISLGENITDGAFNKIDTISQSISIDPITILPQIKVNRIASFEPLYNKIYLKNEFIVTLDLTNDSILDYHNLSFSLDENDKICFDREGTKCTKEISYLADETVGNKIKLLVTASESLGITTFDYLDIKMEKSFIYEGISGNPDLSKASSLSSTYELRYKLDEADLSYSTYDSVYLGQNNSKPITISTDKDYIGFDVDNSYLYYEYSGRNVLLNSEELCVVNVSARTDSMTFSIKSCSGDVTIGNVYAVVADKLGFTVEILVIGKSDNSTNGLIIDNTAPRYQSLQIAKENTESAFKDTELYFVVNDADTNFTYVYWKLILNEVNGINPNYYDISSNVKFVYDNDFDVEINGNELLISAKLLNSYNSVKELTFDIQVKDLASNVLTIEDLDAKLDIRQKGFSTANTYEILSATNVTSCIGVENNYHCDTTKNGEKLTFAIAMDNVEFIDVKKENFILVHNGNQLTSNSAYVEDGKIVVEFVFNGEIESNYVDASFEVINLVDIGGYTINTNLVESKDYNIYLFGDISSLNLVKNDKLECLVSQSLSECNIKELALGTDNLEIANKYSYKVEYAVTPDLNNVEEVTIQLNITDVFGHSVVNEVVVNIKSRTIRISLSNTSADYGKKPNVTYSISYDDEVLPSDAPSNIFTLFVTNGQTDENGEYIDVFADGATADVGTYWVYANIADAYENKYVVVFDGDNTFTINQLLIKLTSTNFVNAEYVLNGKAIEQNVATVIKKYDGTKDSSAVVNVTIPGYFETGEDLRFIASLEYADANVGEKINMEVQGYESSSTNYVIASDSATQLLSGIGSIYAQKLNNIDMTEVIAKYEDSDNAVYYTDGYTASSNYIYKYGEVDVTIRLTSLENLSYGSAYDADRQEHYINSSRQIETTTDVADTTKCYIDITSGNTCLYNGVRYEVEGIYANVSYFTTAVSSNNYVVGTVYGLLLTDNTAPSFDLVSDNAFLVKDGVFYNKENIVVREANVNENNESPVHVSSSTFSIYRLVNYKDNGSTFDIELDGNLVTFTKNEESYYSDNYCMTMSQELLVIYDNASCESNENDRGYYYLEDENGNKLLIDVSLDLYETQLDSGNYVMIGTDAKSNMGIKSFEVSINAAKPEITSAVYDKGGVENPTYGVGRRYTVRLTLSLPITQESFDSSFKDTLDKEVFDITANNGHSIIDYSVNVCTLVNPTLISCSGKLSKNELSNKYSDITVVVNKITIKSYYGVENIEYSYSELQEGITVDFSTVDISSATIKFENADGNEPINSNFKANKVYGAFSKAMFTFTFSDVIAPSSVKIELYGDTEKTSTKLGEIVSVDSCQFISATDYMCTITSLNEDLYNVERLYELRIEGTIQYTSNSQNVSKDVAALYSSEELYLDTIKFTPVLTLSSANRENLNEVTLEINCVKSNVECKVTDLEKVYVDGTSYISYGNYIQTNGNKLIISNLSAQEHTIELKQGAIVDYAGNLSLSSVAITVDNRAIEVTSVQANEGAVLTTNSGSATVVVNFNRAVSFGNGAVITYKFGDGAIRKTSTISVSGTTLTLQTSIRIVDGDNGVLTIVSVNDSLYIKDAVNNFVTKEIVVVNGATTVTADTLKPAFIDVNNKLAIKLDGISISETTYLNATTIENVTLEFAFNEEISQESVVKVTPSLGSAFSSGISNIHGNKLIINLDNEYLSGEGTLILNLELVISDLYGNELRLAMSNVDTKIIYDTTAPEVIFDSNVYYINKNNLVNNEYHVGYFIEEGAIFSGGEISANKAGITVPYLEAEPATKELVFVVNTENTFTITIPAGFYVDAANNMSPAKTITLVVSSDNYTLKPVNYVNGNKVNANSLVDETTEKTIYYVNELYYLYFEVVGNYTSITSLDSSKIVVNGSVITYINRDMLTEEITIDANLFSIDGMNNAVSDEFNYSLTDEFTITTNVEVTGGNEVDNLTYLKVGDRLTFTFTLANPRYSSNVPNLSIIIGNTIVNGIKINEASSTRTTFVYEYVIKAGDNGSISINGFQSSTSVDVMNNVISSFDISNNLEFVAETAEFKPTLTLLETGRTTTSATFEIDCQKSNVSCNVVDLTKVYANEEQVEPSNIVVDENKITINNLTSAMHTIVLKAGAIFDYALNANLDSVAYKLDNTGISVSEVVANGGSEVVVGEGNVGLNILFNKAITFSSGVATITYKFGSGVNRTTTVSGLNYEVSSLSTQLGVVYGDNGNLQIVSISDTIAIKDTTYYQVPGNVITLTNGNCNNVVADTTAPELNSYEMTYGTNVTYEDEGIYYLSATTISQVNMKFVFNEEISSNSSLIIRTNLGNIQTDRFDVYNDASGNYILVELSSLDFKSDGRLTINSVVVSVFDKYNNEYSEDLIAGNTDKFIVKSITNIEYDTTAPVIIGAVVNKNKGNTDTDFNYTLSFTENNKVNESEVYSTKYEVGTHVLILPEGTIVDKAGNKSISTTFNNVVVTVSNDKPIITIEDVTYSNGNKVYYTTNKDNLITLTNGLTCTLGLEGCFDSNSNKLIRVGDNNELIVVAEIYTNDLGNKNDELTTSYVLVDHSSEFVVEIQEGTNAIANITNTGYLVSNAVTDEYKIVFTSSRDIDMNMYNAVGVLTFDATTNEYTYTFDNTIAIRNMEVKVYDFFANEVVLFKVEFDNVAPKVEFAQSIYTFNEEQAKAGLDIAYTIDDENATLANGKNATIDNGATIELVTCQETEKCIRVTEATDITKMYTVTLPQGLYVDPVGNESIEKTITILVNNAPILVPLVENSDGDLVVATKDGPNYYVKDASTIKFKVTLAGTADNNLGTVTGATWDQNKHMYIYTLENGATYNDETKAYDVTIDKEIITVNGTPNIEQKFSFVVYDNSVTVTDKLPTEAIVVNEEDKVSIVYEFNKSIRVGSAPKLYIKIDGTDYTLENALVATNKITYTYIPVSGHNGDLVVVGLDTENVIYDYAYNALTNSINSQIAKTTNYVVDTTDIEVPKLTVVNQGCVASLQNGVTYYYCNSSASSSDKLTINVDFSDDMANSSTLKLLVNDKEVEDFDAYKDGSYVINVRDLERTTTASAITIRLEGTLTDLAGNETIVDIVNDKHYALEGGYRIKVTLDGGARIVSHKTTLPTFTIANSAGVRDDLLEELKNNGIGNYYNLMCGEDSCFIVTGLTSLSLSDAYGANNDIKVSFNGEIDGEYSISTTAKLVVGENSVVTLKEQAIAVEVISNEFTFDTNRAVVANNGEAHSVAASIINTDTYEEKSLLYKGRNYLVKDSRLKIEVKFTKNLYNNAFIVKMGTENSMSLVDNVIISSIDGDGYYTITITKDGINKVYGNNLGKNSELLIEIANIEADNRVISSVVLDTKVYIDNSAPTITFVSISDNKDHIINVKKDIEITDDESGVKLEAYYVDGEKYTVENDLINLGAKAYGHGTHVIRVEAVDNVGKVSTREYEIFVDKAAPVVSLLEMIYNETTLSATIETSDDGNYADTLEYCFSTTESCEGVSVEVKDIDNKGRVTINYTFTTIVTFKNFKLIVNPVSDAMENVSDPFVVKAIELVEVNSEEEIYLTNKVNCETSLDATCKSSYTLDLGHRIVDIKNINEGMKHVINGNYVSLSNDNNIKGIAFEATIAENQITASYNIALNNFTVNIDKAIADEINVNLIKGTTIDKDSISVDNENIKAAMTNKEACEADKECVIEFILTDRSNWQYKVEKTLEVASQVMPTINGISDDKFVIEGKEYLVIYTSKDENARYNISFVHDNENVINSEASMEDLPLGLSTYTFGYYDNSKVLNNITYNIYRVDLNLDHLELNDSYKNEHELDISSIINKDKLYAEVYEISIEEAKTVIKIDENGHVLVLEEDASIRYEDGKIYFNRNRVLNEAKNIVIKARVEGNTTETITEFTSIRFDSGLTSIAHTVTNTDSEDEVWDNSKIITITLTCAREELNCVYYLVTENGKVLVDGNKVVEEVYENKVYEYVFVDDSNNEYVEEVEVKNIDRVNATYISYELANCQNLDGKWYCKNPTFIVEASDADSGIKSYRFGYKENDGTIVLDTANTDNARTFHNILNKSEVKYSIYVVIEDNAGNISDAYLILDNVYFADAMIDIEDIAAESIINKIKVPEMEETQNIAIETRHVCIIGNDGEECYEFDDDYIDENGYIYFESLGIKEDKENISIFFKAENKLGNVSASNTITGITIDVTKPVIEKEIYNNSLWFTNGKYYISAMTNVSSQLLTLVSNEARGKFGSVELVGEGATLASSITTNIVLDNYLNASLETKEIALTKEITTITITILDDAGNVSEPFSFVVAVDTTAPSVDEGYTYPFTSTAGIYSTSTDANGLTTIITKSPINVSLSMISDSGSGIKKVCLLNDASETALQSCINHYTTYVYPTGEAGGYSVVSGLWHIYAYDNVDNVTIYKYEFINVSEGVEFTLEKSTSAIVGSSVTLSIKLKDETKSGDIQAIDWYKDGEAFSACSQAKMMECEVSENATYSAKITSMYGVEKTYTLAISNINTSELVDEGAEITLDKTNIYSDVYFSNDLTINLPVITSTLSQVNVYGYYSYAGSNTVFNLHNSPIYMERYDSVNKYVISLSEIEGIANGMTINVTIVIKAANGKELQGVFNGLTYISNENYTDAALEIKYDHVDAANNSEERAIENNGVYKQIKVKVTSVTSLVNIPIKSYKLVTFNNAEINTSSFVVVNTQGNYSALQLQVTDWFNNERVITLTREISFTLDSTVDEIIIGDKDLHESNRAYIKYSALMNVDNEGNQTKIVVIDFADNRHTFVILDEAGEEIITYSSEQREFAYEPFKIQVKDKAGNVSTSNLISIDVFENVPKAEYGVVTSQSGDGNDGTLTLVTTTFNTNGFVFEGIVSCENDANCENVDDSTKVNTTNITDYAGKYIKIYAYDNHINEDKTITKVELNAILDLTGYNLKAPVVTSSSDMIVNSDVKVVITSSVAETVRVIVQDIENAHSGFITSSAMFMNLFEVVPEDIKIASIISADKWTMLGENYTYTLDLTSLLDGDYNVYVLAERNELYSTVAKTNVKIDRVAPLASSQGITLAKETTHSNNIYVTLTDDHSRKSAIKYSIDGNAFTTYTAPISVMNGSHTLIACDVDATGVALNCSDTYKINIDSSVPTFALTTAQGSVINSGDNVTHGYIVSGNNSNIYIMTTMLKINDMSLNDVVFTIKAKSLSYMYEFNLNDGFTSLDRSLSLEVVDGKVKLLNNEGMYAFYNLEEVAGKNNVLTAGGIEFDVIYGEGGEIYSLTPRIENNNNDYKFALRLILSLALENNNDFALEDVVEIAISADDSTGRSNSVSYKLDLKNPLITTIDKIPVDSKYIDYLSNSAYRYLYTLSTDGYINDAAYADSRLVSCNKNSTNATKDCMSNAGLYLQVVKGDAKTSSKRIIDLLKYIIRIDGSSSYDSDNLNIYYNGLSGNHIDAFDDEEYVLNQLTEINTGSNVYELMIKYTDEAGNYSYYYITIKVSDTISPTISGGGNSYQKITIAKDSDRANIDMSSISATDNYSEASKIKCFFKLENANGNSIEYECGANADIVIDGVVHASYNSETKKMSFFYKDRYTLTYRFSDENNNIGSKVFEIDVNDNTAIEYEITPIGNNVTADGLTINLGSYDVNDISVNGIDMASLATVVLREPNELGATYTIANNAKFVSAKLGKTNVEIAGIAGALNGNYIIKLSLTGTYTITYVITNSSSKSINLVYKLDVVDTSAPVITLSKDGVVTDKSEFVIDVSENNTMTLVQLRDALLATISVTYSDNYTPVDLLETSMTCKVESSVDKTNRYLVTYRCTYKATDQSDVSSSKDILVHVRDIINPTIEGESATNYINSNSITLELPACSDNYNGECERYYKVNGGSAVKYTKKVTIKGLVAGENVIEYYAIDTVGNEGTHYTYKYIVDNVLPEMEVILANQEVENYSICSIAGNESICMVDNDSANYVLSSDKYTFIHIEIYETNIHSTILSKHNGIAYATIPFDEITETGLYRIAVSDKSGNTVSKEFYVYKEVYDEATGNKVITITSTNGDSVENVDLVYRDLYLVQYDSANQMILYHQDAFANITKTDGVYVIGVNANNEYMQLVKYDGNDLYNTITGIKANAPGIADSLINIGNEKYLIMALVDNDNGSNSTTDQDKDQTQNQNGNNGGGSSFTWIFYVLGVVGVLGGGFLIVKLRKKVRVA